MWGNILKTKQRFHNAFVSWVFKRCIFIKIVALVIVLAIQIPYLSVIYVPKDGIHKVVNEFRKGIYNAFEEIR